MNPIDEIVRLLGERGGGQYFGEAITEQEHALQAAELARSAGANEATIAAALLHDVGHLLHDLGEDVASHGIDATHEEIGYRWLHDWFPRAVLDPIRLHVAAKRYLCTVEPTYEATLSPASLQSYRLQGGPMTDDEVKSFEAEPFFREVVLVRRCDEGAKVIDFATPPIDHYRPLLERCLLENIG